MLTFLRGLVVALVLSAQASTSSQIAPSRSQINPGDPLTVEVGAFAIPDLIVKYARLYGVSPQASLAIARCESGFNPAARGDGGLAYNVYQYHLETFLRHRQLYGDESLSYDKTEDHIRLANWAFAHGLAYEWTCAAGVLY